MSFPHSINSQEVAMPTGISLAKGLSSCGLGHEVNVCDEFRTGRMPPVNKARVSTRHLLPHQPCCSSSFHHFGLPCSPSDWVFMQVWATPSKLLHLAAFSPSWCLSGKIMLRSVRFLQQHQSPVIFQYELKTNSRQSTAGQTSIWSSIWGERIKTVRLFSVFSTRSLNWATENHKSATAELLWVTIVSLLNSCSCS